MPRWYCSRNPTSCSPRSRYPAEGAAMSPTPASPPPRLAKNYPPRGQATQTGLCSISRRTHRGLVHLSGRAPQDRGRTAECFPRPTPSQAIIDCLMQEARRAGVDIRLQQPVHSHHPSGGQTRASQVNGEHYDHVIVATGGSPKSAGFDWLRALGRHTIAEPVPSLFYFQHARRIRDGAHGPASFPKPSSAFKAPNCPTKGPFSSPTGA